jgi:predicted unusual protein kinase regulating ubiquinone biosynthesis (AarF/ABC1/UbiB family)
MSPSHLIKMIKAIRFMNKNIQDILYKIVQIVLKSSFGLKKYLLVKQSTTLMCKCAYTNIQNTSFHTRHCAPSSCYWGMANVYISETYKNIQNRVWIEKKTQKLFWFQWGTRKTFKEKPRSLPFLGPSMWLNRSKSIS